MSLLVRELKWYSTFIFFVGAILSFADPITDILTLVEFYRADHKTWFGVGLIFALVPCVSFGYFYANAFGGEGWKLNWMCIFLLAFNPFSAAFARLTTFIWCLKNFRRLWRGDRIEDIEDLDDLKDIYERLLRCNIIAAFVEAMFEAAPQVIIQLYAIHVQEEPVKIIQIISLPISFLSLAWAFTTVEDVCNESLFNIFSPDKSGNIVDIKNKIIFFITNLLLVSSRLFAIAYFTISYKWWIIIVLVFHSGVMIMVDYLWFTGVLISLISGLKYGHLCYSFPGLLVSLIVACLYWIRDDIVFLGWSRRDFDKEKQQRLTIRWLSNVLFVLENLVVIRMFHYSEHSNAWYSLPVSVCVCTFSVIGALMRVFHKHCLMKQRFISNNDLSEIDESYDVNSLTTDFYVCYLTSV